MTNSGSSGSAHSSDVWPSLPFLEWKDTCATLHMWTQIVGKIRLVQTPITPGTLPYTLPRAA